MNYEAVLDRANELYRASKGEASNYMHVEIRSDRVKSILRAIVEAISARGQKPFDKKTYQRNYMRKKRAK